MSICTNIQRRYQMYRHARLVTATQQLTLKYTPFMYLWQGAHGRVFPIIKRIEINNPLWTEIGYATFLHEAGHILSPSQKPYVLSDIVMSQLWGEVTDTVRANEVDAWQWTRIHAVIWTPRMAAFAQAALKTYGITEEIR